MKRLINGMACFIAVIALLLSSTVTMYALTPQDHDNNGFSDFAEDLSFQVDIDKYKSETYVIEKSFKCNYDNKMVGITYYDTYYAKTDHIYSDGQRMDFLGIKMRTEGNSIELSKKILFWTTTKVYDFGISNVNVDVPNVSGMKLNSRSYSTTADGARRQVTVGTNMGFRIAGFNIGQSNSITFDDCVCSVIDNSSRSYGLDIDYSFQEYDDGMSDSYKQYILEGTDYYVGLERLYDSDNSYNQKIYITSKFVSTSGGYYSTVTCDITHTILY
mgnify:CR=1 FL=1